MCAQSGARVLGWPESLPMSEFSTRVLGRCTAPCIPFLISNRVPHCFTQDLSTDLAARTDNIAWHAQGVEGAKRPRSALVRAVRALACWSRCRWAQQAWQAPTRGADARLVAIKQLPVFNFLVILFCFCLC